uniref:Uncharacterized protein n=1 Tax=Meloidogyne enterolobii TaxID=390850 RepID=A0A6V7XRQ7_MELEN|nr:unnamed protein product [Meloidogyne enterolobii]
MLQIIFSFLPFVLYLNFLFYFTCCKNTKKQKKTRSPCKNVEKKCNHHKPIRKGSERKGSNDRKGSDDKKGSKRKISERENSVQKISEKEIKTQKTIKENNQKKDATVKSKEEVITVKKEQEVKVEVKTKEKEKQNEVEKSAVNSVKIEEINGGLLFLLKCQMKTVWQQYLILKNIKKKMLLRTRQLLIMRKQLKL